MKKFPINSEGWVGSKVKIEVAWSSENDELNVVKKKLLN